MLVRSGSADRRERIVNPSVSARRLRKCKILPALLPTHIHGIRRKPHVEPLRPARLATSRPPRKHCAFHPGGDSRGWRPDDFPIGFHRRVHGLIGLCRSPCWPAPATRCGRSVSRPPGCTSGIWTSPTYPGRAATQSCPKGPNWCLPNATLFLKRLHLHSKYKLHVTGKRRA